ncbi:MAG: aspartate aminotransferase family protein [Frankiales bacterium]|nr:aspartate aminotransferase family protein [Frankiales bacterium]
MAATHTTGAPSAGTVPGASAPGAGSPAARRRETVGAARRDPARLKRDLRDHLLLNFTDMSRDLPVVVAGDGCYVVDADGRRFVDGLSGLFCTNLGHSYGAEVGAAAARQLSELVFTPTWTLGHPAAIELAERIASYAPEGMEHVFFTNSGSEAVESAWKLARQWHAERGQPQRRKAISRRFAYHGTTLGALSFTGYAAARAPFEPLAVPTHHVSPTYAYRHPLGHDEAAFCAALLAEVEAAIEFEGADTVAMLIAEPVQNSGGSFMPPAGYWTGLREICDRHGILLVADEVITGFGRVGHWFASERFGVVPDMITFAKGVTAGHAPLGGVVLHGRVAEPFVSGRTSFAHGLTWGGHPLSAAVALSVLDIVEREDVLANVRANEPLLQAGLDELRALPLVGDVRGAGHFWALELVKDKATKETFTDAEADWLLRDALSGQMWERGLLCRLDDRGEPVIQLSPPLVADPALLHRMLGIVGEALEHVGALVERGRPAA